MCKNVLIFLKNDRKVKYFCISIISLVVVFSFYVRFHKVLPVKPIKMQEIKSVQVINLDRSKDRRDFYEKYLHDRFGDKFLGFDIKDIRLSAVDGKKELIFEDIHTGKKVMYKDVADKIGYFDEGTYRIYNLRDKLELYWKMNYNPNKTWHIPYPGRMGNVAELFNYMGCEFSHVKALRNIANQPDGTYGLVLEDDFILHEDFENVFADVLKYAPKNFDMLKICIGSPSKIRNTKRAPISLKTKLFSYLEFGYNSRYVNLAIQKYVGYKNDVQWGANGYIVSAEGARKVLEFYKKKFSARVSDTDFFYNLPVHKIINSYIYTKEMPVLLSEMMNNSVIFVDKDYYKKKKKN